MPKRTYRVLSKNDYDIEEFMHDYDPVSLAVPDQTMSLRDLIRCYQNGTVPLTAMREGAYDSTDVMEDIDVSSYDLDFVSPALRQDQDLTDMDEYGEELREIRDRLKASSKGDGKAKPSPQTSVGDGEGAQQEV